MPDSAWSGGFGAWPGIALPDGMIGMATLVWDMFAWNSRSMNVMLSTLLSR
jgi:hypothetical protein